MPFFDLGKLSTGQSQNAGTKAVARVYATPYHDIPTERLTTSDSTMVGRRPQTVPLRKVVPISESACERPLTVGYSRRKKKARNVMCDAKMPNLAGAHPLLLQEENAIGDLDLVPKPLRLDHDQCLQLPRGFDRVWLLLPVSKRPSVEKLVQIAMESFAASVEPAVAEAMSKAFFGKSGPGLLASLANTAEARVPCTPRAASQERRCQSPRLRDWQVHPYMAKPASLAVKPGRLGTAMKKLGFSGASERSPSQAETEQWALDNDLATICGDTAAMEIENNLCFSPRGGKLDLTQWWDPRVVSKDSARLDERGFALAALASQTRPAHSALLACNASLENLRILSLWSRLQHLKLERSDIMSVEGIEGCRALREVSLIHCRQLRDVTHIGSCKELIMIDLHACASVIQLGGDSKLACDEPETVAGIFSLLNLQRAKLVGCRSLEISQLSRLYSTVRNIVFPDTKTATQCICELPSHMRKQFVADAKDAALQWVREAASTVEPPVICNWEKYIERMDELLAAIRYAEKLGVSKGSLKDAEQKRGQAKLLLHLGHTLTPEEKSRLRLRSGKGFARMRRCLLLIQYMKIRRLDGVTRNDFCSVLEKALEEPRERLCRVYNFLDVEREEILTQEDFERLSQYNGPAATSTVDDFRTWAYNSFGGLENLFFAITRQAGSITDEAGDTVIDYHPFCKALSKLGWKGMPAEIFALLNDSKPKIPYIKLHDFLLIDWLYLSQVKKFQKSLMDRYGSMKAAFQAIDSNHSKVISFSEFRKWIATENVLDGIGSEDCERFLKWMDVNDNTSITPKEFDALSTLDVDRFQEDLCRLRELVLIKWGSLRTAFLSMSAIKVSQGKAKLGKEAKKARKEGVCFVCYEQFRLAMEQLDFKPCYDLHLLFRYLDYDMHSTLVLEDFMALPVVSIADTRECFAKVKAYLLEQWGSYEASFSGLSRAAQQMREEAKDGVGDQEGNDEPVQKTVNGSKAPKSAPAPKKKK